MALISVASPISSFIGPQRTGTSWLYSHLRFHPDILLSRPKEIFFLSSLRSRDPRRFVTDHVEWYLRFYRDPVWLWAVKTSVCCRPSLAPDVIDDIVRLNPAINVILMVRNPVERAWSDAKYYFERRQRRIADVPAAELKAFFRDEYQLSCSRYSENYDNWSTRLLPGHLLLGRFDDIAVHPERMMLDIMRFIGARDDPSYVSASINQGCEHNVDITDLRPICRQLLEEPFEDELNRLRGRFGFAWTRPC